jgi:hypothetical protein
MSKTECGLNGAIYFVEMDKKGDKGVGNNDAVPSMAQDTAMHSAHVISSGSRARPTSSHIGFPTRRTQ